MSTSHVVAVHRPGSPGWIAPGSEQHSQMISPSKVAALLGFSRWMSPYALWMEMKGLVEPDPPKDIYDTGHDVEPYVARRWLRLNPGWKLSPGEVQFVVDPDHFGFPAVVTLDRRAVRGRARRVVEIKMARDLDDLDKFGDDLSGDAPPDYTAQVLAQMLFTGFTKLAGHLMVCGPFWTERCYPIEYDASVAAWMIGRIQAFWESLSSETPPPLDDSTATYTTVRKLHPDIAAGASVQLDPDLAVEYLDTYEFAKSVEASLRGIKTRVLDAMGDAETALAGTVAVAKRGPHASGSVALTKARKTTADDVRHLLGAAP